MAKTHTLEEQGVAGSAPVQDRETEAGEATFRVWACDNQVYGPIPESVLKQWVQETRVQRDTWVYNETKMEWRQASKLDELRYSWPAGEDTIFLSRQLKAATGIDVYELRMFPIFAGLANRDLAEIIRYAELRVLQPGEVAMRRREPGDAIFLVLSGMLRARISVGGDEKVLSKIPPGEFFGEMAMLTQTTRSADVVAPRATARLSQESLSGT